MKFTIITVVLIAILGGGGYLALSSFKNPASYLPITNERIGDLHRIETEPQAAVAEPTTPAPVVTVADPVENDLKTAIQGLIDKKITLKIGSKGPNVGYIQEFMNRKNKKTLKIDNDFGKTLEANVKAFQKAVGVTQTGQIGPATLGKMVDWLNKNPQE